MDQMARERTPGNAIVVYVKGKCVFRYASGFADLKTKRPLTGEEYFNFYSCSKLATVTAGLQLLEKGRFLLTDPLYEYLPEYRYMYRRMDSGELAEVKNPITIRDLFTMSAGFTYNMNSAGFQKARELTKGRMDTEKVARCVATDPLVYEPGTRWRYSIAHDILAGLIGAVEGVKFRDYVKANIFEPLGMEKCIYHLTPEAAEQMATQYRFVPEGENGDYDIVEVQKQGTANHGVFVDVGKINNHIIGSEYDSGGAGVIGVPSEYVKLLAALANKGMGVNGERILSEGSVDLLKTDQLKEEQRKDFNWKQLTGYGYGLGVRTMIDKAQSGSTGSIGEFGWSGAAGAAALMDTEKQLTVLYVQHTLNPREEYYLPRLRNVAYACVTTE